MIVNPPAVLVVSTDTAGPARAVESVRRTVFAVATAVPDTARRFPADARVGPHGTRYNPNRTDSHDVGKGLEDLDLPGTVTTELDCHVEPFRIVPEDGEPALVQLVERPAKKELVDVLFPHKILKLTGRL